MDAIPVGGPPVGKIFLSMLTLFLLILLTPLAAAAGETETIILTPRTGKVGDRIFISGSSYAPGKQVYLYFSSGEADVGEDIDELAAWKWLKTLFTPRPGRFKEGIFATTFKVPGILDHGRKDEEVTGGTHFVYASYTHRGRIVAVEEFHLTGLDPLVPPEGPVGTKVLIRGFGFESGEEIRIYFDGEELRIHRGERLADEEGAFRVLITIPPSDIGHHTLTVEIGRDRAETEFTVEGEEPE